MKKILFGLMAIVSLFTMAGCEKKNTEVNDENRSNIVGEKENNEVLDLSKSDYLVDVAGGYITIDYENVDKIDDSVYGLYVLSKAETGENDKIVALSSEYAPFTLLQFKDNGGCSSMNISLRSQEGDNVYIEYDCNRGLEEISYVGIVSVNLKTKKLEVVYDWRGGYYIQQISKDYLKYGNYFYKISTNETLKYLKDSNSTFDFILDDIVYSYGTSQFYKSNIDGSNTVKISFDEYKSAKKVYDAQDNDKYHKVNTVLFNKFIYGDNVVEMDTQLSYNGKIILNGEKVNDYNFDRYNFVGFTFSTKQLIVSKTRIYSDAISRYDLYQIDMTTGEYKLLSDDYHPYEDYDIKGNPSRVLYIK